MRLHRRGEHATAYMPAACLEATDAPEDDADGPVDVTEVQLCTHMTVVVRARLEHPGTHATSDVALVIPRHRCVGDRPRLAALKAAAADLVLSAPAVPSAGAILSAHIGGQWRTLFDGAQAPGRSAQPAAPVALHAT